MSIDRTRPPAGEMWLEAPDWRQLDTVARRPEPWVLWRIGFQSLLAHWMDESVRRNVETVHIIATDRAAQVEADLQGAMYWSRNVVVHSAVPADAPAARELMSVLPGQPRSALPDSGAALLHHWLSQQLAWLAGRNETVSVDRQLHPRVWIGPRVSIHPQARLTGPCWIGAHAQIGAGTEIGPGAIVGANSVINENASVHRSVVMPDTYVGSRVHLEDAIADGASLLDTGHGTRVDLTDRFVLARLNHSWWSGWWRRPAS